MTKVTSYLQKKLQKGSDKKTKCFEIMSVYEDRFIDSLSASTQTSKSKSVREDSW